MPDDDDPAIDRDALEAFPRDIEPIVDWLRCWSGVLLDGPSEYADDPSQLEPGLRVLAEIVGGELEEATAHLRWVQTVLTEDPRTVVARNIAPGVSVIDAAKVKAGVTRQARQVLRARLRDVVEEAQLLDVPAWEVASLLTDVVSRIGSEDQAAPTSQHPSEQAAVPPPPQATAATSNVVSFDRARRSGPGRDEPGPPRSRG